MSIQSDQSERTWSVVAVDGRGDRTIINFKDATQMVAWIELYSGAYEQAIQYQYALERERQDYLAGADF
jgi:hypothetical protein